MTYSTRDAGQNIGGVMAAMSDGKGVPRGIKGSEGFRARSSAARIAASRKLIGPMPLSDSELAIIRQIERVRGC